MSIKFKGQIVSGGGGGGAVSSVNGQTGAVNIYADDSTLNIDGAALTLTGTGATSTLNVDVGTTANKIVQLDGTAKLPAVDGSALTNLPSALVTSVNTATGAVNIYADDTTLNIDGTALTLSGTGATSTLNVDVGTTANKIVQLDGTAKLPAVDGSALTNLPTAPVASVNTATGAVNIYADDSTLNIDGTALTLSGTGATSTLNVDVGTTANKIVQLDGTAKLPAVDGSQLTNLPSAPVTSVNTATGAVNIYADDTTLNIDGTALTLSGTGATSTLNVDVGTTANKIVQLDGTAKLPAVDGSALTNLPSAPVTSVNTATGAVNIYADDTTLNIDGTALTLSGTGATSTLNVDVGTAANKIVQLDGTAKLPAVDGSALTNLPAAPVTSVNTATGAVVLDTDDIAEGANLYFTTARVDTQVATLPMSTLSDVAYTAGAGIDNYVLTYDHSSTSWGAEASAGGGAVSSVNGATGAVNIYADDSTLNIDGTALTLSGTGATSTLNVDVGTTANKIVQLDGTAKLPAVDGSQLTNLPSGGLAAVVDDTTPQLGGSLDVNGQSIVSVSNGDITIAPNGTGIIKTTGSVEPDADLTRTIGAESLRYLTSWTDINGAIRFKAKNDSGGTMTKGQVVYIKGISGSVPTVDLARSNSASTMPAFGLVHANANDQAEVTIITLGNLNDVNTTTYSLSVGDTVYVSSATAGALTNTAPTGESNLIQNIGRVVRADASAGIIKVGGAGRSAATPNLDNDKIFLGNGSGQAVSTLLSAVNLTSLNQDLTTSTVAEGTNEYFTTARVDTQIATLPMSTLSDVAYTAGAGIDNYVLTYDHSSTSWGAEAAAGGGGARPTVTDITATPYTVGTTDGAIGASELERTYTASTGAGTVNLPTAVGLSGFKLQIKRLTSGAVTVDPDGTEHIDHAGQTTFAIGAQYDSITLQSDNANWILI